MCRLFHTSISAVFGFIVGAFLLVGWATILLGAIADESIVRFLYAIILVPFAAVHGALMVLFALVGAFM